MEVKMRAGRLRPSVLAKYIDAAMEYNMSVNIIGEKGRLQEALDTLEAMKQQGIQTYASTYSSLLHLCTHLKALPQGKLLHLYILRSGFQQDTYLSTALVRMYTKCGSILDARKEFDRMARRNASSWNAIIVGYFEIGDNEEVITLFKQMQCEDLKADKYTLADVLKACVKLVDLEEGKSVHSYIIKAGIKTDTFLKAALVSMYAKCGSIQDAEQIFDMMPKQDVISWNVMISGYSRLGRNEDALKLIHQMQQEGVKPNVVSWNAVIAGNLQHGHVDEAMKHFQQMQQQGIQPNIVSWNAIIAAYTQHSRIEEAFSFFCQMQQQGMEPNVVSWNAMIAGYAHNGHGQKAFELFSEMQRKDVKPNNVTITSLLNVCADLAALEEGRQVHAYVVNCRMKLDIFLEAALVNMYARCGGLEEASKVFARMRKRDLVSWTTMITGYNQHGYFKEALELFNQMQNEGLKTDVVLWNAMIAGYAQNGRSEKSIELFEQMLAASMKPDSITYTSVLNAVAALGALEWGKWLHASLIESGLDSNHFVATALVHMYIECGCVEDALKVFNRMNKRDLTSWNAMILGCAMHGHGEEALELFKQMQYECLKPNQITIFGVLSACSHAGLLDEGHLYFTFISRDHGIVPTEDHYICMLDLFSRTGCFDEALHFISNMHFQPEIMVWRTLLSACRIDGNVILAEHALESALRFETDKSAPYVLLSNAYGAAGRWEDRARIMKALDYGFEQSNKAQLS